MLNLINEQRDIDKIYLYAKDLDESKYEYLIKNRENAGIKQLKIQKHLLTVQIQWIMFMKILTSITQIGKEKY